MQKRVDWLVTELNTVGGTEIFLTQMAPLIRYAGWDLHIITLINGGPLIADLRHQGVPVIELDLKNKFDFGIIFRLNKLWMQDPPAIIHTHLYHAGILARFVAHWGHVAPVIVHQHGPESTRSNLRVCVDRLLSSWTYRYVSTCEAVAEILKTREKVSPTKIDVIYNGIPFPDSLVDSRPIEWPVPDGKLTLVCVGRLSPEKGQHCLLEALEKLGPAIISVYTVFIGTGDQLNSLIAESIKLEIQDRVSFVGLQQNVYPWLFHADIFVLASDWEGISLAILEAMAAGLPVIATDVGGNPEVVVDGETGVLVPPRNPQALAGAILQLAANPIERQRMGLAGRQRVEKYFSIQETARKFEELYTQILINL